MPKAKRYEFAPVDFHLGDSDISVIADRLGVKRGTVDAWRRRGLSETQADQCATAIGMDPYGLWPEMLDAAIAEHVRKCETCDGPVHGRSDKRFCAVRCREQARRGRQAAAAKARYQTDADYRQRQRDRRRLHYRTTSRRAELAKQRIRDRENAAVLAERRRARRLAKREAA